MAFVKALYVDSIMICTNCEVLLKDETELAAYQKVCSRRLHFLIAVAA